MSKVKETMGKCFQEKLIQQKEMEISSRSIEKVIRKLKQFRKRGKSQRKVANMWIQKIKEMQTKKVNKQNMQKVKEIYEKLSVSGKYSQ